MIAAGLDGIASGGIPDRLSRVTPTHGATCRVHPRRSARLLTALESSEFVSGAFGNEIAAHYAAHARAEWQATLSAVTDWELVRGFEAV